MSCNPFPPPVGPNDITVLQYGGGFQCDCGPPRYNITDVTSDNRLVGRVTQSEIQQKFESLNVEIKKKIKNPLRYILPGLGVGLICMAIFQVLPIMNKRAEQDRRKERDPASATNTCEGRRVCSASEARDPYKNNCCSFYCCESSNEESGYPKKDLRDYWDNSGPYLGDGAAPIDCPRMETTEKMFWLWGKGWDESTAKINATKSSTRRALNDGRDDGKCSSSGNDCCACDSSIGMSQCTFSEPATCDGGFVARNRESEEGDCKYGCYPRVVKINPTLTLGAYVADGMFLGCRCNIPEGTPTKLACDKMIVQGKFDSMRKVDEHDEHDEDDEDKDYGLSILDILRYMGGFVVFLCVLPGIILMCKQKEEARKFIIAFFDDWVRRGILTSCDYFPGTKHAQPRLILRCSPSPGGATVVAIGGGGTAGVVVPVVSVVSVVDPSAGVQMMPIEVPYEQQQQQQAFANQVMPMDVPTTKF